MSEYPCPEPTWYDLVRQYYPKASNDLCSFILWEHTGYPEFWMGDPIQCCSEQIAGFRRTHPQAQAWPWTPQE